MKAIEKIEQAMNIIKELGLPQKQQNERSILCLLALCNIPPDKNWNEAQAPFMGITPIMEWIKDNYGCTYAPNTRETFRRQTIHQFVAAGIAIYNPDNPDRAVNSPKTVYQVSPEFLSLIKLYGTENWQTALSVFLKNRNSLVKRYARERDMLMVPLSFDGTQITISPGAHSELIKSVVEDFAPRFAPGSVLIYVGDTGNKWGYFDEQQLTCLGIKVDSHGKMPDVIFYDSNRKWLFLVEAVTSHGPIDNKRYDELTVLFSNAKAGLVYVTAFPDMETMSRYARGIAWETEVWIADAPSHLIHFNGNRFLGPYKKGTGSCQSQ